ncbi:MAG: GMC family oxidoreductase [Acidobacteriaceae bacterium]|nr:GMC family oxidoreductase [Acidobacteriaceae bacterium]
MNLPRYAFKDPVDFAVIGAGAAGGVVAKELSVAGFSVVVLEQGPYLRERDFGHDEIKYSHLQALTNNPKFQPVTYRKTASEPPKRLKAVEYGRQVGGGSVHFTGNYWRFHESDFQERSLFGEVADADLQDWPITYADLEPYYTKAEWDLGISGLAGANPFEAPRSRPYPLPPKPPKSSGVLFEGAARKLGLHPFPAPVAILSQPYNGRAACADCGFCEQFGCEMGAKSSTLASVIPVAERTGRCEIRPHSYVRKIELDSAGRASGVIYFNEQRQEVFQRAKAIFLCANGVETPKLLLLSKSNRFPDGLANSSGMVGTHLMWDNGAVAQGLFEHALNEYKGIQVTRLIHDYYASDRNRGFYGGGGIDARFDYYPASFALTGLPVDAPKWGREYKRIFTTYYNRTMMLLSHTTSLAQPRNTVTLDQDVRDAWGLPGACITSNYHPDDVATMKWLLGRQLEILDTAGALKTWVQPYSVTDNMPSRHLLGTCRMGLDPAKSVVNAFSRTHDVKNLFLVDGSNFVTSGRQQPTATIQALAYRAADHAIRAARKGELG